MNHTAILMAEWSWIHEMPVTGAPFDLRMALIVFAVAAVVAAVIISAAILMPGIGIVASASLLQTCIEIGVVALATGLIVGTTAGFVKGGLDAREAERERVERLQEIREVDHFLDVHFVPSSDDPDNASDFACVLVAYDATAPESPVVKTEIESRSADTFYEAVRTGFERWLRRPIKTDGGRRSRHVAIFMRPYPGDGVYERIRQLCEQRAEVEISRVDGQWQSRLEGGPAGGEEGPVP